MERPLGVRLTARLATTLAAATVALSAGLLGCGGASDGRRINLPGEGPAVGHLICFSETTPAFESDEPDQRLLVQGAVLSVTFTVWDVNLEDAGRFLPVSFEAEGGFLSEPPDLTDELGRVTVVFVAEELGPAVVRLIQPGSQLICDVAFRIVRPTCTLTAEVLDGSGAVVPGGAFDACGGHEAAVERDDLRRVRFRVTRPHPVTEVEEPVGGATLRVRTSPGLEPRDLTTGPTDGVDGEVEAGDTDGDGDVDVPLVPVTGQTGTVTLLAEVLPFDETGDGIPDQLDCNTCELSWELITPPCDVDGEVLEPVYLDADGTPGSSPVRPLESAEVSALFERDGTPVAGLPIRVTAANGTIDGAAAPVIVATDGAGSVTVTYVPDPGFAGVDEVTFIVDNNTLVCTKTAEVEVVTCDFDVDFAPSPVVRNVSSTVTVTLLNADLTTALDRSVFLSPTFGSISPPPPTRLLDAAGMATATFTPTLGYDGPATLTIGFTDGYPCEPVEHDFTIMEP